MLRHNESLLNKHETDYGFKERIDAITSQVLSPENIDTYADTALTGLVHVVGQILEAYKFQPTVVGRSEVESEHSALSYFGLDQSTIEATLDHIARLADQIHWLDQYISDATESAGTVITPTDHHTIEVIPGSGSFEEKATIPRLKTILLLLTQEYGVDLTDPEQYRFIPGTVTPGMLRQTPYNVIDLPSMNRVIDVCDEEDNVTFVFDREKLLADVDIDSELVHMTKSRLKKLLLANPSLGRVLKYSDEFSAKINGLLDDLELAEASPVRLLKMENNESVRKLLSVNAVSILLFGKNTKRTAVNEAVRNLGDSLGEVYYVGSSPRFDTDQVGMIREYLIEAGHLNEEQDVDESELFTMNELATVIADELSLGRKIDPGTIRRAIESLGDRLYLSHQKGAGKKRTAAYTVDEKDAIKLELLERLYKYPPMPNNYVSFGELAKLYDCVREIIERGAKAALEAEEIRLFRMGNNKIDKAVTKQQQESIETWLDTEGYIWPQEYISITEASAELNVTKDTIQRLARKLLKDAKLTDEDVRIRVNTKSGQLIRYSPHAMQVMKDSLKSNLRIQRAIVRKVVNAERYNDTVIPGNWLTNSGIAAAYGLDRVLIGNCATYLYERGEITRLRDDAFTAGDSFYYPPEAVERIVTTLANKPPEDWLTVSRIQQVIGRGERSTAILSRYKHTANEYWYMGQPMLFYPPSVLQDMVAEVNEFPPEGWMTVRMMRSEHGGSARWWDRTIEYALANKLVVGAQYRGRKGQTMFYSPVEQEALLELRERLMLDAARSRLGETALK